MGIKERQERDREAVRRAILDAARELFVAEGFQNVSIRKIAERIEYSPAAIYGYFPSKDDIFFALAEEGFRLLGDPGAVQQRSPLQGRAAARARPRHLLAPLRIQPRAAAVLRADVRRPIGAAHQPRVRALRVRARDRKQHIVEALQACIDAGELPRGARTRRVAMRTLMVGVLGVAVLRLSDRLGAGRRPRPARRRRAEPHAGRPPLRRRAAVGRSGRYLSTRDSTGRRCSGFITPRSRS